MRVLIPYRWLAVLVVLVLGIPLAIDIPHHIFGTEIHVPRNMHLHRYRAIAPILFGLVAIGGVLALRWTQNRWERRLCWAVVLWFLYEGLRFALWVRTHHLLHGPWSWIFWIPAVAFAVARAWELQQAHAEG